MGSRIPGPGQGNIASPLVLPARTPGPLGINDAAEPSRASVPGDTPGPTGVNDHAKSKRGILVNPLIVCFGGAWDDDASSGKGFLEKLKAIQGGGHGNLKFAMRDFFQNVVVTVEEPKYFTWEDEVKAIKFISQRIEENDRTPLCLIGHSFGGDTAVDVADALAKRNSSARVDLLITLDAVSPENILTKKQRERPLSTTKWVNLWVEWEDIKLADLKNISKFMQTKWNNIVAKAGGHWCKQSAADRNIPKKGIYHNEADKMLVEVADYIYQFMSRANDEQSYLFDSMKKLSTTA